MILKLKLTPGIYLVGFMGCGKTTVGRALADELGWSFFDIDEEIEQAAGCTVTHIFETHSEAAFREMETAALRKRIASVKTGRPQVISLGGGAFSIQENFDLACNHGITLWLDTPYEVIERRVASETHRPLAHDPERMRHLYESRRDDYARADYRIEPSDDDPAKGSGAHSRTAAADAVSRTRAALAIFRAALEAADPARAVKHHVRIEGDTLVVGIAPSSARYRLADFDRIWIAGAGKAAIAMAGAVEELLGERIAGGCISVPDGTVSRLKRVRVIEAAHPFPDRRSVAAGREIARIASACGRRDLLLCVISGGASALLALPGPGVTLATKKRVTKLLQARGATIQELNAVRKHLSAIKGGHLARLAYPATVAALILSDVIGDNLDAIGSGPTVPDPMACADAQLVSERYGIPVLPFTETPKPGDPAFRRVKNLIVGSNRQSMEAARTKAEELGYRTIVLSTTIDGETRDIARMHAAIARELVASGGRRVCFLSGGETTVTLRGKGLGGRNQEFVLAALQALEGTRGVTIFSAGTDGRDGPTDAAGAVAESSVKIPPDTRRFLDENNSYRFFEREGGLIKTGPTGTNVMDVRIVLIN